MVIRFFARCLSTAATVALSTAVVLAAASGSAAAQQKEPLNLGFLMPLTGGSGKLGQMMMEGSTLAADEINAAGGINGHPIKLLAEDSQGLARQGVDGFRKLTDIDGAQMIITGWTAVVSAVAPLAEREKVFLLSASTASPAVRGISPYFQSTWMFDDETVRLILPYAKKQLGVQRLGLFTVISDLGKGLSASIKKEWSGLGGELVAEESHQQQETNFRPSLLKMLSARPDAIYITSSNGGQSAQIIRQARELGYQGRFLSYGAIEDPEILAIAKQAEGLYYTSPAYAPTSDRALTKEFVSKFQNKHNRVPNVHQANHYDLVYMYKQAAEALMADKKPLTGASFQAYFRENMPRYEGSSGNYRFNYGDGSVVRSTLVKTVEDGKFVKVAELD